MGTPRDTCTPSPGNQGGGWQPLALLKWEHLPDRVTVGPVPTELSPQVGPLPAAPHSSISLLSPAATLKSKQDELHRKALQMLER